MVQCKYAGNTMIYTVPTGLCTPSTSHTETAILKFVLSGLADLRDLKWCIVLT